jgi:hypothetical protein
VTNVVSSHSKPIITQAGATTPTITHLSMPVAGTEYSHALATGLKKLTIIAKNDSNLQFSFTMGTSGTIYVPIPQHTNYYEDKLTLSGKTIYIQSDAAAEVAIILEWT